VVRLFNSCRMPVTAMVIPQLSRLAGRATLHWLGTLSSELRMTMTFERPHHRRHRMRLCSKSSMTGPPPSSSNSLAPRLVSSPFNRREP
jgi:hypothetical protein